MERPWVTQHEALSCFLCMKQDEVLQRCCVRPNLALHEDGVTHERIERADFWACPECADHHALEAVPAPEWAKEPSNADL